jgi:hypothetical protein
MIKEKIKSVWDWIKKQSKKLVLVIVGGSLVAYVAGDLTTNEISLDKLQTKFANSLIQESGYGLIGSKIVYSIQNNVMINIGEDNTTDFQPNISIEKGNSKFKLIPEVLAIATKDKTLNISSSRIDFGTPKIDYIFFDTSNGYEFLIILKEQPISDISLGVEMNNVDISKTSECYSEASSTCPIGMTMETYDIFYSDSTFPNQFLKMKPIKVTDNKGNFIFATSDISNGKMVIKIDSAWLANATYPVFIDPLFDSYGTNGNSNGSFPDDTLWFGQTFTASANYCITDIGLRIWKAGTPGSTTISIRATSGGIPTGSNLASIKINSTLFSTSESEASSTFTIPYNLTNGVMYAIVGTENSTPASGNYILVDWYNPGSYASGTRLWSTDDVTWTADSVRDFTFRTWGTAGTCPVSSIISNDVIIIE